MTMTEKVKELSRELKIDLTELNKERIRLITLAVLSMRIVRSIHLKEVANGMLTSVQLLFKEVFSDCHASCKYYNKKGISLKRNAFTPSKSADKDCQIISV